MHQSRIFNGPTKGLAALIHFYRYCFSPWMGWHCRFEPTCSAYALQALERYGAGKGVWLTVKRVCRCHPWHPGGVDPVL